MYKETELKGKLELTWLLEEHLSYNWGEGLWSLLIKERGGSDLLGEKQICILSKKEESPLLQRFPVFYRGKTYLYTSLQQVQYLFFLLLEFISFYPLISLRFVSFNTLSLKAQSYLCLLQWRFLVMA
jgi:hypothetical protein